MEIKIYGLFDPRNPKIIRYVGKTKMSLRKRLQAHLDESRSKKHGTYKINWVNSLLHQNIKPEIRILEECTIDNWQEREKYWISKLDNLTNSTEGGEVIGFTTTTVYQYSLKGIFIKKFDSIEEACEELKVDRGLINSALQRNSEGGKGGNYLWRHGKHKKVPLICPYINHQNIYIEVTLASTQETFVFPSLKEALKTLKLKRVGNINRCIDKKLWYKNEYFFRVIN